MILTLHISNYALITRLDINFHKGFNIITGETGAGKSIILGALGLLLGGRADMKAVRDPQKKSVIEAIFSIDGFDNLRRLLEQNDIDGAEDSTCILRRELTPAGRSRAFINDTPVNLTLLRDAALQLVDIHSQHQNLLIADRDYQLSIIDSIADNQDLRQRYRAAYDAYRHALKEFSRTRDMLNGNKEATQLWQFQLEQLQQAALQPGEQTELEEERELLTNVGDIKENIVEALDALSYSSDNVLSAMSYAVSRCRAAAAHIDDGESLVERLESARIEIQDITETLEENNARMHADPDRLLDVEDRLNRLYSLQSSYRCDTVEQLIALRNDLANRLETIDNSDEVLHDLETKARRAKKEAMVIAQELSNSRRSHAAVFAAKLKERATPMGMQNLRCEISMTTGKLTPSGIDEVEFLFAFNKNQTLRPVGGTASGGEISRLMLSIKSITAECMNLPTIIFDEVDTGVSGEVATRMADMMKEISGKIQVVTITHLPAVAARGDVQFKVFKQDDEESTFTSIRQLSEEQRVEEIAAMISGDNADDAARTTAKRLLNTSL
ncbi:MAG: DNA repair protein RecN [Muribaculaceae bacterium]|nr:DNA repair protein RecN [Muribaculaceae bacterium]